MKTKKLNKKLTFSKSTIADLNSIELNDVLGGSTIVTKLTNCPTCYYTCPYTCYITCRQAAGTACADPTVL